jgi:glucosamine--fructose-6-phosphate aminotransferase (isomerizing)
MRAAVAQLRGSFTLLAIHADNPSTIVGVRRNSPLVAGIGKGENFLASDVAAFIEYTKRAVELGQDEVITMTPETIEITDVHGAKVPVREYEITWDKERSPKGWICSFHARKRFLINQKQSQTL